LINCTGSLLTVQPPDSPADVAKKPRYAGLFVIGRSASRGLPASTSNRWARD
jgi:hypothetical protein